MAEFDIKYSESTTSGSAGVATRNLDLDTGAGLIGRAVAEFGEAGYAVAENIQKQEDDAELSNMKRQANEVWNAAWESFYKTSDPESRESILTKAKEDAQSIVSERDDVNLRYTEYMDNALPQWDRWYGGLDRQLRQQKSRDDMTFNGTKQLESGDMTGYLETLDTARENNLYTEEEYKFLRANAINNMVFAQSRVQMDTDPEGAVQKLESLTGLSGAMLDERDKLISYATSKRNQYNSTSETELHKVVNGFQSKIVEGETNIQAMLGQIAKNPTMSDEDKAKARDKTAQFFRDWGNTIGSSGASDTMALRNMEEAVDDLLEERIEKDDYWTIFAENKAKLNGSDQKRYITEAEPTWDKMVQNRAKIADAEVKGRVISRDDAAWDMMQNQHMQGLISDDLLNAEQLRRDSQVMIYSEYKNAVLELVKKDLPGNEYRSQLKQINRMYISKGRNWYAVSRQNKELRDQYDSYLKTMRSEFDRQYAPGAWDQLDTTLQAAFIDQLIRGRTMQEAIEMANSGLIR